MYTVEKTDTYQGFQALKSIWESLLAKSASDNVFLSHTWIDSWWSVFGSGHDLYILTVKHGDEIAGIAPFMRSPRRIIQFIGTPNADYSDIIGPDKHTIIPHIYGYLADHADDWRRIDLQQIPDGVATVEELQAAASASEFPYTLNVTETCAAYIYDGPEEKRSQFVLRRNKTMRKNIRSFTNDGGLKLVRVQDPDEIKKYLPSFFHGHITRWDNTPTPSKFLEETHRRFYHALAEKLGPRGHISLMLLMHNDRPIAHFFTYDYKKKLYLYTTVFDLYFGKKSPGLILINMMTDIFIRLGYTTIDHTRGTEGYKRRVTNATYENYRMIIYRGKSDVYRARLANRLRGLIPTALINENRRLAHLKTQITARLYSDGVGSLLRELTRKFRRMVFDYRVMFVMEHTGTPPQTIELPPEVTIEHLGESDIELIGSFLGFESESRKHQVIQRRFANGGECFVARYKGEIAAMAWGMFKEDYLTDVGKRFPLKENEVDLGDAFTSPVYRRLGLHSILTKYRVRRYAEKNLRIVSTILSDNVASLRSIRKNGFTAVGKIRSLKVFGLKIL